MAKADKDTWVDDPNRPGVQVLVRAGDELPTFGGTDAKAVSQPAEDKSTKAPAKK